MLYFFIFTLDVREGSFMLQELMLVIINTRGQQSTQHAGSSSAFLQYVQYRTTVLELIPLLPFESN